MTDRETNQPVAWRTTTTDGRHTHFTENARIAEQWSESGFDVTPLFISAETPSPASQMVGWQPIATAPTDGRDLIMTSTDWNGDILVGSFAFGKWRENPSPEGCSFTPTHWMPIPPMPGTTEGQPDA